MTLIGLIVCALVLALIYKENNKPVYADVKVTRVNTEGLLPITTQIERHRVK